MAQESKYAQYVNPLVMPRHEAVLAAAAYDGRIANPPLFFDKTVYPHGQMWVEILHAYAPGGSFGTPVLKGMEAGHKHVFDENFLFFGSNPDDIGDLGGEVEFWLGEGDTAEKYMLTKSTSIYVPAGVVHSPCVYRKIHSREHPIILVVVAMVHDYVDEEIQAALPTAFRL